MLFEGTTNGGSQVMTIPTTFVPFFWNLNNLGRQYGTEALGPLKFSLAEILMVITFVSWLVRAVALREFKFERGAFFWFFAAYLSMVIVGWFRGVATNADINMALWEVRSQFHFFAAYLLAANLIRERKDVIPLIWVGIIGVGIKGLVGIYAYIAMGGIVGELGVLYHEDSLLFNVIFFYGFVTWLAKTDTRMKWACIAFIPACLFTTLQNQRRAGIASFIVAFIPLVPVFYASLVQRRKEVARFAVFFACISAIYLPIAWNGKGAWALPARAIRSNWAPDDRDASSDYYRLAETINLKATRDDSPWIGIGYGKPYKMVVYQPGVEQFDEFLKYLPHNSIMWVWMRIGHIGFFTFVLLIGAVCVKGVQIVRQTQDTLLQTIGVQGVAAALMLFTFGKYDLAMVNYRVVIMAGVFIGVLGVLRRLDPAGEKVEAEILAPETYESIEQRMLARPQPVGAFAAMKDGAA
jgi:hypothetical protein